MDETSNEEKERGGCRRTGCMLLAGALMGVGVLSIAILLAGTFAIKSAFGELLQTDSASGETIGADTFPDMDETWSSGEGDIKCVRIPLNGEIDFSTESPFKSGTTATALRSLRRATCDEEVKAVILDINSGGGGITASDIVYKAVKDFKDAQPGRVVVAVMGDLAASGAYYVAVASDWIIAHPTTVTGSIGVIMQSWNVRELAHKVGVTDVTIKSGANKDLLNPFKEVDPAQHEMLLDIVKSMHNRFVTLVSQNRKIPEDKLRPIADGRVFDAQTALAHRLIDAIGYSDDARKKVAALLNVDDVSVYRYEEKLTLKDLFGHSPFGLSLNLPQPKGILTETPKLQYRWAP